MYTYVHRHPEYYNNGLFTDRYDNLFLWQQIKKTAVQRRFLLFSFFIFIETLLLNTSLLHRITCKAFNWKKFSFNWFLACLSAGSGGSACSYRHYYLHCIPVKRVILCGTWNDMIKGWIHESGIFGNDLKKKFL